MMIHISTARLLAKRASATVEVHGDRAVFWRGAEVLGSTLVTGDSLSEHAVKRILAWEQEAAQ